MDGATIHAYFTVILFIAIVGIWIWAWSKKRKPDFDEAARLALEDDARQGRKEG